MCKRIWLVVVLVALLATAAMGADSFSITTQSLANDETVKVRLGFGDPNLGTLGPYGCWTESEDGPMWGAGLFGQINLSTPIAQGLSWLFKVPDTWWTVLERKEGQRAHYKV